MELLPNGELLVFSEKMLYHLDAANCTIRPADGFQSTKLMMRSAMTTWRGAQIYWFSRISDPENNAGADLMRLHQGHEEIFPFPETMRPLWKRLIPGKAGHLWLIVGRLVWDLAPAETPDFNAPDYVFDAVPTVLKYDRSDNIWVGTNGYGLRKINHLQGLFNAGADNWTLNGVWVHQGRYFAKWVNEIRTYDPSTRAFSDQPAFPDAPVLQVSMVFEPTGTTWLLAATEEKNPRQMLLRYAPGSQGPAERIYTFATPLNLRDPMLRARDGRIWIATHGGKLVCFDPARAHFDYFDAGHLFGDQASVVRSVAIAEDADGTIWVGTILGLVKCTPTPDGLNFALTQADSGNPNGLNNNSIACILPTANDQLWLGTKGGGINVMDTRTGRCRHITTANGLLNNVVYGILAGNRPDEYWCSTNRGLAKINVRSHDPFDFTVTTYTAELGLQDNEFNTQAYYKADSGELLFGGINGLNHFFPEKLPQDTVPPPVYTVGVEINHQPAGMALLGGPPELLTRLELDHNQNNLSFEFAALDFTAPAKNRYRYRLSGLDDD
ncbi:MAG: hypothetical protein KDC54_09000, partial [Lewinella sp.]|nr:hypothetical protein [Lewinella sp.]